MGRETAGSLRILAGGADEPAVRELRDGASLLRLFALASTLAEPAAERLALLRWALFQMLAGNTDAHGKNLSYFCGPSGLRLAPAYDIVCTLAFDAPGLDDSFAMAIGDAFQPSELTPYEWAHFAHLCDLNPRLVARELKQMATRMQASLDQALGEAAQAGAPSATLQSLRRVVASTCARHLALSTEIPKVDRKLF